MARETVQVTAAAERVVAADPTKVWSLVADPERIREWAGFELTGYMGTELPKPGQRLFITPRRLLFKGRPRQLDIESWDAGTGIGCLVAAEPEPTSFRLVIHPEVEAGSISTRVRLVQRSSVSAPIAGPARRWLERHLARKIDRIDKAASA